ncbi:MAG: erythromycin esterase family protein [Elusimicrobia bacterium]|nr:erythromycin esterase family protein [Elusimicrobiota bacterium]
MDWGPRRRSAVGIILFAGAALLFQARTVARTWYLPAGVHALRTLLPWSDGHPLDTLAKDASVIALGETLHTSGGVYKTKVRVIKDLVERFGFRVVAFETPWTAAQRVEDYLSTGRGSSDEALEGLFGVWRSEEVRELLEWMRRWNLEHPDDSVHFMGFDIQQPWDDFRLLGSFLREAIPDQAEVLVDGLSTCAGVRFASQEEFRRETGGAPKISSEEQNRCLDGVAKIGFALRVAASKRAGSSEIFARAHVSLRGLEAWQKAEYYEQFDGTAEYMKGFEPRDEGMAEAFLALRSLNFPEAKTVLWSANLHISQRPIPAPPGSDLTSIKVMGCFLAKTLGASYVPVALTAYRLETDWPMIPNPPPPTISRSLPKILHDLDVEDVLVDLTIFNAPSGGRDQRFQVDFQLPDIRPVDHFRALIFVDHSPPARMLRRRS